MVNVMRSYVERQERPDYLHPVDEDGNYPWKKGYKHEAQPMSASGASKGTGSKSAHGRKRPAKEGGDEKDSPTKKKTKSKTTTAGASESARGRKRPAKESGSKNGRPAKKKTTAVAAAVIDIAD